MITYISELLPQSEDGKELLKELLGWQKLAFNEASKIKFNIDKNSIVLLHKAFYKKFRQNFPYIPAQIVIRAEQECLSSYRSIKTKKHKLSEPPVKKNLSCRLDKHLFSRKGEDLISITTGKGRKLFKFRSYEKLRNLLRCYIYKDPLIFEKNGSIFIALSFEVRKPPVKQKLCIGVDLGIRVSAATSEGKIIIDKKFNGEKRKLRYLKRKLQSIGTKSAKRKLKKYQNKERNKNKNQTHLVCNEILKTTADTIALENLKGIKAKKHKRQNKNRISQVPLYELRRIITYKATNMGKHIVLVNPAYTSQIDSVTGKHEGKRRGRRFYSENGLIYDADINAARNIAIRSKLPISQGNLLDGQAVVIRPNVQQ